MGLLTSGLDILNKSIFSSNSPNIDKITKIYATGFSTNNNFVVNSFYNTFFDEHSSIDNQTLIEMMKSRLLDFNISELQNSDIEEWVNYRWSYTTGRPNINRITFTFRDTSNTLLYTYFKHAWWKLKDALPEEQRWRINVDSINDSNIYLQRNVLEPVKDSNAQKSNILNVVDAILDSVSGLSLDKENVNGLFTFSITFRYFINYVR